MPHSSLPPFAAYAGAKRPKLLIVGEAWGKTEEELQRPFMGASGALLWQILGEAIPDEPELHAEATKHLWGIGFAARRDEWLEAVGIGMTNVLALRPFENKLENITLPKKALPDEGKLYPYHALVPGRYLDPQYFPELDRLAVELDAARPNLVLALGGTASWAFTGRGGISGVRGAAACAATGPDVPCGGGRGGAGGEAPQKILVSYHPAGVMRQWSWRPILLADCIKAWREAQDAKLTRPARQVVISPSLEELTTWTSRLIANSPTLLSCDIETKSGQITCIGFADSPSTAMVVPFWSLVPTSPHYWPSWEAELIAWSCVSRVLSSPIPKLFQNGMYDLQYLLRMGLQPRALAEDTMLMHHSMFPELQKGLGFLGSIYTNESSWKLMRRRRPDVEKSDE